MTAAQPTPPPTTAPAGERFRVAMEYALGGDLRFLSHHDELRLLARAVVRARWPVAYSRGFNPLPRLVVPLPRSLGTAAECQLALVDLGVPRRPEDLFASLSSALPAGCRLLRIIAPAPRGKPHARRATYEVELDPSAAAGVGPRLGRLSAAGPLVVQRDHGPKKPARPIDIQPYLDHVELEGRTLRLHLRIENQRSARPVEVLTELGLAAEAYQHRLLRGEVQWDMEITGPSVGTVPHERKPSGKKDHHEEDDAQGEA